MCGICGIVDYNDNTPIDEARLRHMCAELKHRGPDDEGFYISRSGPSVGLGHRRLSIIDLSDIASQPMSNEDGTIWIIFNGEIYNYKELRPLLEAQGHRFKSNSDTETIIHLYELYGKDCVQHLRGMFAFAIWDERKQLLLLARDRVGKKPLVYSYRNNKFCFASEFSSLLESGMIEKKVAPPAIYYYLTFGYIPAPLTIYEEVFKLPPGHIMVLDKGGIKLERYWTLSYHEKLDIGEEEAAGETLKILEEAVKIRLYSDVPLGAFLSGGIDSSIVVALMSRLSGNKVKTFSIGFEEQDYSELNYAREVAKRYDTDHHEFIVKPKALEILPLLVERYGEPYADSSSIPSFYVAQQTKRFVTVALNGDGGDESFSGYERYQAMVMAEAYNRLPPPLKKITSAFTAMLPDSTDSKNKFRRTKRFLNNISLTTAERYLRWVGIFGEIPAEEIFSSNFLGKIRSVSPLKIIEPYINDPKTPDLVDRLMRTDINSYLPYDLLVKMDIVSMANSLEARSPFLDHKLMEFAARLPASYKMRGLAKKFILKKAAKDLIPGAVLRRGKMGFGVPVGRWFRKELKDFLTGNLLSDKFLNRGYFEPSGIKRIVGLHVEGKKDYSFQLWALLILELWHQRFLDG